MTTNSNVKFYLHNIELELKKMSTIYNKMFLQNENNKKYKQLIHLLETNKKSIKE
jgi:hypothetical protein